MSKKVLNYAGRRPMLLALIMATAILGLLFSGWLTPTPGRAQGTGGGNPTPNGEHTNCDTPTTSIWCGGSAELVLKNVTISPAAPTNAPYDSIVCVGARVSANLQYSTLPSTNASQTCHTCNGSTPTNYCDPIVYTAGASPYNITNEWWNCWWWDYTNGIGNSVPSFTFTNATTGEIWFDNISAQMTTNAPGCGVWVHWADNAHSWRSYAFVEVSDLSAQGYWPLSDDGTNKVYRVCVVPTNAPETNITVVASPDPGMMDKFLPAGWQMTGGMTTTNADTNDVTISRTRRLVDITKPATTIVTCVSGCSQKQVTIVVQQAVLGLGKTNVFVNADDENHDGIPDKDDPITGSGSNVANESDLIPITLNLQNVAPTQMVTLSVSPAWWSGGVRVWNSQNRGPGEPVLDGGDWNKLSTNWLASQMPTTLWVEGVSASGSIGDVSLSLGIDTGCSVSTNLTVIDVTSVTFQANTSPLTANSGSGGGLMIYPDKPTPSASGDLSAVKVVATITPVMPNITLYFKAFDVDDPSSTIAPVDDETKDKDNRGLSADGDFTISAQTDNTGTVTHDFHVSMQPGDNFRVVASPLASFRDDCLAAQSNDHGALVFQGSANEIPGQYTADMLTVWRRLHVEVDSMAAVPAGGDAVFGSIIGLLGGGVPGAGAKQAFLNKNLVTGLTPNDNSLNLDTGGNGRFENGSVLMGSAPNQRQVGGLMGNGTSYILLPAASGGNFNLPFTLTSTNNITTSGEIWVMTHGSGNTVFVVTTPLVMHLFDGGTITIMGQTYTVAVNGSSTVSLTTTGTAFAFELVDDDDQTLLPRNPDASDLARAFQPAYVTPLFDLSNPRPYAPFVLNLVQDDAGTKKSMYAFDNVATEADPNFWTIYLLGAFQHLTDADSDPNSEGATLGEVDDINGQGAMIFLEDLRETTVTTCVSENYTVSHEVGHLFNGIHSDGGLMAQSTIRTSINFSDITINSIRKIPHP